MCHGLAVPGQMDKPAALSYVFPYLGVVTRT